MSKHVAITILIFCLSIINSSAQDSLREKLRFGLVLNTSVNGFDSYGWPVTIAASACYRHHLLYMGPVFFLNSGSDAKRIGGVINYSYYPDPKNKRFRLYFPLSLQIAQLRENRIVQMDNFPLYGENELYDKKIEKGYTCVLGGFGFSTVITKHAGTLLQTAIGYGWDRYRAEYYINSTRAFYTKSTSRERTPTLGILFGLYFII